MRGSALAFPLVALLPVALIWGCGVVGNQVVGSAMQTPRAARTMADVAKGSGKVAHGLDLWTVHGGWADHEHMTAKAVPFDWYAEVRNTSREEIVSASFAMEWHDDKTDRVLWMSPPKRVTRFSNDRVPLLAGLQPLTRGPQVVALHFTMPRSWFRLGYAKLIIVAAENAGPKVDLHDAGHLNAFLIRTPNPRAIETFRRDPSLIKVKNAFGLTPTLMAFANGDRELIDALIAMGGNARGKTTDGRDAMFFAASSNRPDNLARALELGLKVDRLSVRGMTPLAMACQTGAMDTLDWLLAHGANPRGMKGAVPPMLVAIDGGQPDVMDRLLAHGAKIRVYSRGRGAVHNALYGSTEVLEKVLALGVPADDAVPGSGITALMEAAMNANSEVVTILAREGADPDLKDAAGHTAYDYAGVRTGDRGVRQFEEAFDAGQ